MKRSVLAAVAALALLGSLWTPKAFAQAVYGSILGTITDPSGAAVGNAKVTVTDQRKGTSDCRRIPERRDGPWNDSVRYRWHRAACSSSIPSVHLAK